VKTNYWNTRNYKTNRTGTYAYTCSWLFSTGWGNTARYIASLRVRVPIRYEGSDSYIQFDEFPLGDSNGDTYYSSEKVTVTGYNNGDFWADFSNLSQAYKKKILAYGVFVSTFRGACYVGSDRNDAQIECVSYQGRVTPTGTTFTSGTVARYTKYRLQWTTDAEDDFERRNSTCKIIITDQDGGNSQTYTLSNGATSFDLDTTAWSSGSGIRWRVQVGAYGSGTVAESATYSLSLADPTAKVDDLRPTSKTYYGFDAVFSWAFTGSIASGAISGALQQGSAVLQYRTDNMANPAQFASVSNGTTHVTVNCANLPIGSYQWRVVAKSSVGTTHTSNWVQCTNVEVPISVKGTTPAADAHAPRAVVNRFSWVFSVDSTDSPGTVTQRSAVLYFKTNNESDWHQQSVSGSQQYCDVPANTFTAGCVTLDWYVVAVANTGTKATSAKITVSTKDARSTPVAISPAGEYLDDAVQGITFIWAHANITGTAQCGWELSYSIDSGASYLVLAKADNAANRYEASAGTFPSGVIYWRIRTKNTDNEFGDYSGAAIFAIRRAPVAPVISYYDNKPLAKMRWQAKEQDGYEVAVDGISLGVRYGTGKEWQSDAVLTDGKHTLQVRIYNTYGDVSPWSSCEINVQNQPGAALAVYAEGRWGEVLLRWDADNGYILRDGELIAKAEGGTYTDRTSAAAHQYIVRVFDAEGYYTDSAPVLAAPSVPYAAIGLRDGTDWLAMKYATSYQNYSKAVSLGGSYQQYWGKERPVWHDAGNRVVTHTISHACKREEELLVLRSLAGQEVIYKDRDGHLAIGVFKDLQESREHGCTALSFSITETQQEVVKYDPV
jgi:hypothetical protein